MFRHCTCGRWAKNRWALRSTWHMPSVRYCSSYYRIPCHLPPATFPYTLRSSKWLLSIRSRSGCFRFGGVGNAELLTKMSTANIHRYMTPVSENIAKVNDFQWNRHCVMQTLSKLSPRILEYKLRNSRREKIYLRCLKVHINIYSMRNRISIWSAKFSDFCGRIETPNRFF